MAQIKNAVVATAQEIVLGEVEELVGKPWARKGDSPLRRGGTREGRIFLDGEPFPLTVPRIRDLGENREQSLETYQALASRDALDGDVERRLIQGISTRKYEAALSSLAEGYGLKKSAVSSAFKRASQKDLDALNGRDLRKWTFLVVYIDGTVFKEHTCVVALGITTKGEKVILGVREGATENAVLVSDLLDNMEERGLTLTRRVLFVLDGAKALRTAVLRRFGKRALVQRCTLHKKRNVLAYLPEKWKKEATRPLNAAWAMNTYDEARQAIHKVLSWLEELNESAASSLKEDLEETLTVHWLGIQGTLRRTLVTTNPIESPFDTVATHARRVKRWRGANMVMRWVETGLVMAENHFRRVKGYTAIPKLIEALENDALIESRKTD